jgi:hypothetical protein
VLPARGGSLVFDVVATVDQIKLHIRYVDGLYPGTTLWTLWPHENCSQVCYEIGLEPQGFLPRLLSHVMELCLSPMAWRMYSMVCSNG